MATCGGGCETERMQRRTKIVATLGPSTDDPAVLAAMIQAGADVVRVNFSHGSAAEHAGRIAAARKAAASLGRDVGVLGDLRGPKIRIERFAEGRVTLLEGDAFILDASLDPDGRHRSRRRSRLQGAPPRRARRRRAPARRRPDPARRRPRRGCAHSLPRARGRTCWRTRRGSTARAEASPPAPSPTPTASRSASPHESASTTSPSPSRAMPPTSRRRERCSLPRAARGASSRRSSVARRSTSSQRSSTRATW